jgi:hypothetical protein
MIYIKMLCRPFSVLLCMLAVLVSTAVAASGKAAAMSWDLPSWTPIDIDFSTADPLITLCKLDFKSYYDSPSSFSKFRDLVKMSKCVRSNKKIERLSKLKKIMEQRKDTASYYLEPTGFVFHESRVGSTLVANMLASDPYSMVFSESAPPSRAIKGATGASRTEKIAVFRDIIRLMGLSTMHKKMFFKFQSIQSSHMDIVLEVWHYSIVTWPATDMILTCI